MPGIIVGIDGSEHSHFALEWAMRYAALRHLPLTVITVLEDTTPGWAGMMVVPSDEQYLINARDAAQDAVAKAEAELREKLREAKDAYWTEQVDIEWQIANAWVLYAEGKHDDALKAMSAAADAEDKTEKHPVTPGVPTPARELYGQMLLDQGLAKEALAAFEATLKKEPHRFNATAGAATAAAKLGDKAKATAYSEQLIALADGSNSDRPALIAARQYVAKN